MQQGRDFALVSTISSANESVVHIRGYYTVDLQQDVCPLGEPVPGELCEAGANLNKNNNKKKQKHDRYDSLAATDRGVSKCRR